MENKNTTKTSETIGRLISEVEKVVVGKKNEISMLVTAMLAGGHVLIEDVPGTGKTTLISDILKNENLPMIKAGAQKLTEDRHYGQQAEDFIRVVEVLENSVKTD